mmetsp:Transcript_21354/g.35310  ORF Transcript_21354/g.35310 Transcript_21354/m.35310 type:complete len:380 (+) Transcript_21354:69-1208(+)
MWATCRAQEKKIEIMQSDLKRRAERRKALEAQRALDPFQSIRIVGRSCKLYPDATQHKMVENGENLMPWQGKVDNMIDRFDGRALLDMIFEYDSTRAPVREETIEELEENNLINYERYRSLVYSMSKKETEERCLKRVMEEEMRSRIAPATIAPLGGPKASDKVGSGIPSGQGSYAAVAFAYSDDEDYGDGSDNGDDVSSSSSEDDPPKTEGDLPSEDDKARVALSEFGLTDFGRIDRAEARSEEGEKKKRQAFAAVRDGSVCLACSPCCMPDSTVTHCTWVLCLLAFSAYLTKLTHAEYISAILYTQDPVLSKLCCCFKPSNNDMMYMINLRLLFLFARDTYSPSFALSPTSSLYNDLKNRKDLCLATSHIQSFNLLT